MELPDAAVQRAALVRAFVDARKKDGTTVLVLLDESQMARRMPLAKEVVQALAALGVKAVWTDDVPMAMKYL